MKSTNYRDTLITASPDTPVHKGIVPGKPGTVAAVQHALLARPYAMTSDDLIFAAYRERGGGQKHGEFFGTPPVCLAGPPLEEQFGWGVHHDGEGRIALLGMESAEYRRLLEDPSVAKAPGMRRAR